MLQASAADLTTKSMTKTAPTATSSRHIVSKRTSRWRVAELQQRVPLLSCRFFCPGGYALVLGVGF
jgi:hypothetical protein